MKEFIQKISRRIDQKSYEKSKVENEFFLFHFNNYLKKILDNLKTEFDISLKATFQKSKKREGTFNAVVLSSFGSTFCLVIEAKLIQKLFGSTQGFNTWLKHYFSSSSMMQKHAIEIKRSFEFSEIENCGSGNENLASTLLHDSSFAQYSLQRIVKIDYKNDSYDGAFIGNNNFIERILKYLDAAEYPWELLEKRNLKFTGNLSCNLEIDNLGYFAKINKGEKLKLVSLDGSQRINLSVPSLLWTESVNSIINYSLNLTGLKNENLLLKNLFSENSKRV